MATKVETTRAERGIALAVERSEEFEQIAPFTWMVPASGRDIPYTVDLELGFCSCPDEPPEGEFCKHTLACEVVSARRAMALKAARGISA